MPLIKKPPAPHQSEALSAIEAGMAQADRATVVMACGTGKTLLEMWAAQAIDAKRTVVFVPTLNLLQQVFHEWRDQNAWGSKFRPLCVCSDSSVGRGDDEIELRPEDLDFPTSTHPGVVNEFLDAVDEEEGARAVIFCTYQSAHVLGTAMGVRAPGDRSLGSAIFDEAHKTVGEADKAFAFALSDKNLALDKRLFFTATPRVFDSQRRLDENGDPIMASMDDVQTYGEQVYTLSFAEAAEREIIVPYKVLISVVDDAAISSDQLDRARVLAGGQVFDANTLAKQIALRNAMSRYGLKKAITFHSTVDSAENFSRSGRVDLGPDHPGGFSEHVSGRQKTVVRDGVMQRFRDASKAVVSNARCLTEGVDVPAVDLVAFMDTKKSKVDIVQAAGRAMRRAGPQKTHGYILIPLHLNVHDGESPEEALARSDFSVIADVLRALADSDEALMDVVRGALSSGEREPAQPRHGRHGSGIEFDLGAIAGGPILQERLLKGIQTRVVQQVVSAADRFIDHLATFVAVEGRAKVPVNHVCDDGYRLWQACNSWRQEQHRLTPQQRQQLDALGFRFDKLDAVQPFIDHLAAFVAVEGHAEVPQRHVCDDGYRLGIACGRWRQRFDRLTPQQRQQLDALGFRSDKLDAVQPFIDHLVAFVAVEGHAKVPQRHVCDDGYRLGIACSGWRQRFDRLTPQQRQQLDALGFSIKARSKDPLPRTQSAPQQIQVSRGQPAQPAKAPVPPAVDPSSVALDHKDAEFFVRLQVYKDVFGDLDLERTFKMVDGFPLGARLAKEIKASTYADYPPERRAHLTALGVDLPDCVEDSSQRERERMRG